MEIDMEYYHCGFCGKYVAPENGYYGDADKEPQRVYCDSICCEKAEKGD